jgi:hypothetical protein
MLRDALSGARKGKIEKRVNRRKFRKGESKRLLRKEEERFSL